MVSHKNRIHILDQLDYFKIFEKYSSHIWSNSLYSSSYIFEKYPKSKYWPSIFVSPLSCHINDLTCPSDVIGKHSSKFSHARRLTTTNRLLKLGISTPKLSQNLIILMIHVIQVFLPILFEIKMKSNWLYGDQHFWKMIYLGRQLQIILRKIFTKYSETIYILHIMNSYL